MSDAAVRQWWARGGAVVMGRVLPMAIGLMSLAAFGGAVAAAVDQSKTAGLIPSFILFALGLLAAWLLWKVLRTVWLVTLVGGSTLTCTATTRNWSLDPGDVVAVRGDAYHLFLVIVTPEEKIWLWGQVDDRAGLLSAIRKTNPAVAFDRYVDP